MTAELIYGKMAAVIADTMPVEKNGYNETQRFKFRSIDDTVSNVRKALIKHKVAVMPEVLKVEKGSYQTAKGSTMNTAEVLVSYTFVAEDGSSVVTSMVGEAADSGDKAMSKALSMAFKYVLFQTFLCGTDGDPDSETVEEVDPDALTNGDKTKITLLGKAAGVEKDALRAAIEDAVGRAIASTSDLRKGDMQQIETYLTNMATNMKETVSE